MKNANLVLGGEVSVRRRLATVLNRNLVRAGVAAIAIATVALTACAKEKPPITVSSPKSVSEFFPIKVGDKVVRMQLAVTRSEQERGLMERRDLGSDDGMVFVYAAPQQMHFWMHNTPTALDIGFFDSNGVLLEVYPMQPFDERTVASRSSEVKFPLEMNQGWFAANNVRPGAKLDLKAMAAALRARGFEPARFGLGEDSK